MCRVGLHIFPQPGLYEHNKPVDYKAAYTGSSCPQIQRKCESQ